MSSNKLIWALRILIALLFVASAIMKLFPIEAFEKQLVDLGITNWCLAPPMARGIIAFELFLGLGFLQNHFFKKFIMPMTLALLVAFIIHLSIQIKLTGNSGNCGCMGQAIPMTPLEAILKNIVSIVIIGFIYWKTPQKNNSLHRYPAALLIVATLSIFLLYPMECCCDTKPIVAAPPMVIQPTGVTLAPPDTTLDTSAHPAKTVAKDTLQKTKKTTQKTEKPVEKTNEAPQNTTPKETVPTLARVVSEFAPYTQFTDGVVNLDAGKNIVCVFNTTCDHCMATAKDICELSKKQKLPPIHILFWSEADAKGAELDKEVAQFFAFSGCKWPYTIVDVKTFFRMLGKAPSPPRVALLNEGNIIKDFSPLNFSKEELSKASK